MIKKFLLRNLSLKIASLFLAIILCFYVAGEQKDELEKRAILDIEPPAGMIISNRSTDKINILFRGPKNKLNLVSPDITIRYKIKNIEKAGKYSFTIPIKGIEVPSGVKIASVKPSIVAVKLDKLISKWLPIKVNIKGEAAEGYRVVKDKIRFNPNISLVKGPEKLLENLEFIYTSPIEVTGYIRSFTQRVSLQPFVKGQLPSLDTIEVDIPIEENLVNKDFSDIPLKLLVSPTGYFPVQSSASNISIVLKGPKVALDKLSNKDILAFTDVTGLQPGRYELPVNIKLPPNIFLFSDVPLVKIAIKNVSPSLERTNVILPTSSGGTP